VYYCSEACQQRDWEVHKKTCGPKYHGTLDALDQMTLDDAEGPSSQSGSFGDFWSTALIYISSGADVNAVLPGGNSTLLHLASKDGSEESVRALIAAGADINHPDEKGATALLFAAQEGCEAAVRALIAAGAEVDKATRGGQTPLFAAGQRPH
jgi:cytohesin